MRNKAAIVLLLLLCVQAANADWVRQQYPTLAWLRDVYFFDESHGWIVGSEGTVLTTSDAGGHWSAVPKFNNDTILRIHFTDASTGWMLCERNVYSRGRNASSYLRKTSDGGVTWEMIELRDAGRERLRAMIFTPDGRGIAFGEGGVFYTLQPDGKTWKKSNATVRYLLLAGSISDSGVGVIAGAGGTLMFTLDGGSTWDNSSVTGNPQVRFNSVFFTSPKIAWTVGSDGSIFTSSGGGRSWRQQVSGTDRELTDIWISNTSDGWAVGDQGVILHTSNGGAVWEPERSPVKHRLERVIFNGKRGWAVGYGGTILSYSDTLAAVNTPRPTLRPKQ
ncbi:MAG: YCF48-related protein [Acidobacteriota bacterium]